jgi:hypothetical protein
MLDALALLPTQDVCRGRAYIQDHFPDKSEWLIQCFHGTYVTGTFMQACCRLIRRIPSRFTPSLWNVHDATVNSDPRTNNQCEGWNNKFKHIVGHKHPSVSSDQVPKRRALVCISLQVHQDEIGNPQRKS